MSECSHCLDWRMAAANLRGENARLTEINRELRARLVEQSSRSWGGHVWERINESRIFCCQGCGVRSVVPHEILLTCAEAAAKQTDGRRVKPANHYAEKGTGVSDGN